MKVAGIDQLSDFDAAPWTQQDKDWAWYMFLIGVSAEELAEKLMVDVADVRAFVRDVISDAQHVNSHPYPLLDHCPVQPWRKRHDWLLIKLRAAHRSFADTCRLMERSESTVTREWLRIKKDLNG